MRYALAFVALMAAPAGAQQASTIADVRQAYGSRLDQPDLPAVSRGVTRRLSTRINNRIDNRLSTRVQRYAVSTTDPAASYRSSPDDGSRRAVVVPAPLPALE